MRAPLGPFKCSELGRVRESVNEGRDTTYTSLNYTLDACKKIEVLSAASGAPFTSIRLTGNRLNNLLIGAVGSDRLDGVANISGGDTLYGLGGNDSYLVRAAAELVIEAIGGGLDGVTTSISYKLAFGSEVEFLSASLNRTKGLALTGNEFAN